MSGGRRPAVEKRRHGGAGVGAVSAQLEARQAHNDALICSRLMEGGSGTRSGLENMAPIHGLINITMEGVNVEKSAIQHGATVNSAFITRFYCSMI